MMDTLIDPAATSAALAPSFDVRVLNAGQLDAIRATIKAWLDSYGVSQFARLPDGMSLTRATLIPVMKLQLRTRFDHRKVSSKTAAFRADTSYEERGAGQKGLPIWGYLVGEDADDLRPGVLPPQVTEKVRYSDRISGCAACHAVGSSLCGTCDGRGDRRCGSCHGNLETECTSCRGAGEKKCWTCNGHGEKTCHACRSGTLQNGERCRACHGRGFTRCNECRDGFRSCTACARRGIIRCPSCNAMGRVSCDSCSATGRIRCAPCQGSGKIVTSLYVTASQSEKLAQAWVLPPNYDELVPKEVLAWLQSDVGTAASREVSRQEFATAPCEPADSPLAIAANRLIAESAQHVRNRFEDGQADLSDGNFDRIIRHWYAEHSLPLVKVEYRFEGKDHSLWTVDPGITLNDHQQGFATKGTSVFASEGPMIAYLERLLDAAASALESGRLAESGRLTAELLQAAPGLTKAAALKAAAVRAQRRFASLGTLLAAAGASALYFARFSSSLSAALSDGAIASFGFGALAAAAPFALQRVVYKTRAIAVFAHCALVSAALLPAVAMLNQGAPHAIQQRPPVAVPVAAPAPPPVAAAGFDCDTMHKSPGSRWTRCSRGSMSKDLSRPLPTSSRPHGAAAALPSPAAPARA
ncbi:MAG: hypothetical protein ACXWC4_22110 [Telluria sp.]